MPTPNFGWSFKKKQVAVGESGGFCYLMFKDQVVCTYYHWAFSSCGVDALQNFQYGGSTVIKDNFESLCEFLKKNSAAYALTGDDTGWKPQEYLMCITQDQRVGFGDMLKDPRVREIDHFLNKAHGPNTLHLYRISLQKDFPK